MDTSIPIPPVIIQHVCFHAWKLGIMTQERERVLQEDVAGQVTDWLNANAHGVSVLHVATAQTGLGAYATVWYRPQS